MRILSIITLLLLSVTLFGQKLTFNSLPEAYRHSLRGERPPSGVEWMGDNQSYSFTKNSRSGSQIWIRDIPSGEERMVFSSSEAVFPGTEDAFRYASFAWTSDYQHLLFQTNFQPVWRNSGHADYYLYSLDSKELKLIVENAFTAEVSPDGSMVGYGKDGDLYTYNLAGDKHTRLSKDGAKDYYNGRYGWANEEEFGLVQAWAWSHNSKYMAYWQTDETEVEVYKLTDFSGQHPEYMELPYPKVGDAPPVERLGILNVQSGKQLWLDLDPEGGYIPRIYWTSKENTLAVVWLNRAHNHLKLYMFDVVSGKGRVIMEEKNEAWIDIFDFFAGEMHLFYFPGDMDSFFWISDRDGYSHIYHYDYQGKLIRQLSNGDYDVVSIKSIDPKKQTLSYLSCEVSPMERQLFSLKFNGKGKKQLTLEKGNHRVNVSPSGNYFIDTYSSSTTPSSTDLRTGNGKLVENLAGHENVLEHLEEYAYSPRELFTFTASDGQLIDGYIVKPVPFDPEKTYPLIMSVYGGPGSQGVYNSFEANPWIQYLVQQGYVLANINNRGNGGYGSEFEKTVYKHLGEKETGDFSDAALFLAEKEWIDRDRIGIMGHSFGGFSAGMSLLLHPDVFRAGIVTAAISDHRNYDCILTERYMGLLESNEEGYNNSSMVHQASRLEGKLLLVHSLMDDNVHPQNTFQFSSALINEGKKFDLMIYPAGDHGVAYDFSSYMHLQSLYLDWLNENLKGEESSAEKEPTTE